ncbi:MAG: guanylate kinase [Planctomycetes bacterium]|nr:guanylate kinase [Planctomycetota bacterium]
MAYPAHGDQCLFLVVSGPSGAGKSTLIRRFLEYHPDFTISISATTRPPRAGEGHGVDYWFVDDVEFARRIRDGELIEHAQVFGKHFYGTPRSFITERFAQGMSVIKDIDVQGANQIREAFPQAVFVFVVPPRREQIEARLRGRGTDSDAAIQRRLLEAEVELAHWRDYDYLVFNDELERAAADLGAIVRAGRLRIARENAQG